MYFDLAEDIINLYEDGQVLYYTPSNEIWAGKPSLVVVEKKKGYSAKLSGLPSFDEPDNHYIKEVIIGDEVYPISEDSHPELFIKLGFGL